MSSNNPFNVRTGDIWEEADDALELLDAGLLEDGELAVVMEVI